jgi:hypothetical protein
VLSGHHSQHRSFRLWQWLQGVFLQMSSGENITMNIIGVVRDSRCSQLQKVDLAKAEVKGHADRCIIFQIVPWLFSVDSDVIFLASNENSFSLPRESDVQSQAKDATGLSQLPCRSDPLQSH